jgi:hypothetical protein
VAGLSPSNVLGTKIAVAAAFERAARSETLYDRSVDAWLRAVVDLLGPASKETAIEAMRSLGPNRCTGALRDAGRPPRAILMAILEQNRREFGPRADRPD